MSKITLMAPSSSKNTAVRKAAQAATQKIQIQAREAGQSSGSSTRGQETDQEHSPPPLSQVLKMEKFTVLEITDCDQIKVEEEIRANDEWVFLVFSSSRPTLLPIVYLLCMKQWSMMNLLMTPISIGR